MDTFEIDFWCIIVMLFNYIQCQTEVNQSETSLFFITTRLRLHLCYSTLVYPHTDCMLTNANYTICIHIIRTSLLLGKDPVRPKL